TTQVKPSAKLKISGEKVKTTAFIFENAPPATVATQMSDSFRLKKGWNMSVMFLP
ncbi:hypothetical protein BJV74DRAFT_777564, partial [Russula compacta]